MHVGPMKKSKSRWMQAVTFTLGISAVLGLNLALEAQDPAPGVGVVDADENRNRIENNSAPGKALWAGQ